MREGMVGGLTAGGEGRIGEGGVIGRTRVERNYESGPIHGMAGTGTGIGTITGSLGHSKMLRVTYSVLTFITDYPPHFLHMV